MTAAVFQHELISLMKSILDEASAALPEAKRTSAIKADMASVILARASGVLALREISAGLAAARIVDVGRLNQNGPFGLEAFDCHHQQSDGQLVIRRRECASKLNDLFVDYFTPEHNRVSASHRGSKMR